MSESYMGIGGAAVIVIMLGILIIMGIVGAFINCYKNFMKGYRQ